MTSFFLSANEPEIVLANLSTDFSTSRVNVLDFTANAQTFSVGDIFGGDVSFNDQWIICGINGQLYKSTTATKTWVQSSIPVFGTKDILDLTWHDVDDLWIAVGDSILATSEDGGNTWIERVTGVSSAVIYAGASDGTTITYVSGTNVLTSTNNGATWTKTSKFAENMVGIDYDDSAGIWGAVGPTRIYTASSPTGTWTQRTIFPSIIGNIVDIATNQSSDWLFVTDQGDVRQSTNDAVTWSNAGDHAGAIFTKIKYDVLTNLFVAGNKDGGFGWGSLGLNLQTSTTSKLDSSTPVRCIMFRRRLVS